MWPFSLASFSVFCKMKLGIFSSTFGFGYLGNYQAFLISNTFASALFLLYNTVGQKEKFNSVSPVITKRSEQSIMTRKAKYYSINFTEVHRLSHFEIRRYVYVCHHRPWSFFASCLCEICILSWLCVLPSDDIWASKPSLYQRGVRVIIYASVTTFMSPFMVHLVTKNIGRQGSEYHV